MMTELRYNPIAHDLLMGHLVFLCHSVILDAQSN